MHSVICYYMSLIISTCIHYAEGAFRKYYWGIVETFDRWHSTFRHSSEGAFRFCHSSEGTFRFRHSLEGAFHISPFFRGGIQISPFFRAFQISPISSLDTYLILHLKITLTALFYSLEIHSLLTILGHLL